MTDSFSRRDALKQLAVVLGAAGLAGGARRAAAAEPPHLDPKDPNAVALAYNADASQVDPKQYQTYRPEQRCDTCLQLQGQDGQPWRPCNLFPGDVVSAGGWCRVWVPKS
jgi:hypothetical protein